MVLIRKCLFMTMILSCTSSNDSKQESITFDNLRIEDIGISRAVLRFDTSVPTTCEAEYGLSADELSNTAIDPNMMEGAFELAHEIPLEDLLPATTYYYRAKATDAQGVTAYSDVQSFSTLIGPTDGLVNIAALEKGALVTSVSSNFGGSSDNNSSFGANKAFDNIMATEWSSNGDGDDAFVEIDLGETKVIEMLAFRSRKMSDGSSIILSFEILANGLTKLGPYETPDPDILYTFDLDEPLSARTIRLDAVSTTGGNTGIKEFQLLQSQAEN